MICKCPVPVMTPIPWPLFLHVCVPTIFIFCLPFVVWKSIWSIQTPWLPHEWTTLFSNWRRGCFRVSNVLNSRGPFLTSADGPVGRSGGSYQNPNWWLDDTRFPVKRLFAFVIQKPAGVWSVFNNENERCTNETTLLENVLYISIPSSTNIACPRMLYATLLSMVRL